MFEGLNWGAFLLAMALVELTPGPNMGWLAAMSAQSGRLAGLRAVAGVTLGLAFQVVAAAIGLSALISEAHLVYEILRWAGVGFMLYLALQSWRESGAMAAGEDIETNGFRRGLIANLLNPKALVFYIAVVGQFADPDRGHFYLQILLLGGLHLIVALAVHLGIVVMGARLGEALGRIQTSLPARAAFALGLVAVAIWIAIGTAH